MTFIKVHHFKSDFNLDVMSDILTYGGEIILNAEGIMRIEQSKFSFKYVKNPPNGVMELNPTENYTVIYARYGKETEQYIVAESMHEIFQSLINKN